MSVHGGPNIIENDLLFCLDAGNPKSFSPNVFPGALDIYTWYFSKSGTSNGNSCTVARDTSTSRSPAGGIPMRMDVTGSDPHVPTINSSTWNVSTALTGQTWTVSVYVKGSVNTTAQLFLSAADSTGVGFIGSAWISLGATTINVTTEWTRQSFSFALSNASIAYIQFRLDGPDSGGTGQSIWWDGLQLELGSSATAFNPMLNTNRSTWTDLSSNKFNFTLYNYPSLGSNLPIFTFNGSTQYAMSTQLGPNLSDITYSAWVRANTLSLSSNYRTIIDYADDDFFLGCKGYYLATYDPTFETTDLLSLSTWYNFCVSHQLGGPWNFFINGVKIYASINDSTTKTADYFSIAAGVTTATPNELWNGDIAVISAYSKGLTDNEVQENFSALRGRFGI